MTTSPKPVAVESFLFWKPLCRLPVHVFALLADEDGETSFRPHVVGDHSGAFGPFQWHNARAEIILKWTGIDVRLDTTSHLDMLKAAHWEMTDQHSEYRHVWPALMDTSTPWDSVSVLVRLYEKPLLKAPNIVKRVGLLHDLEKMKWPA